MAKIKTEHMYSDDIVQSQCKKIRSKNNIHHWSLTPLMDNMKNANLQI